MLSAWFNTCSPYFKVEPKCLPIVKLFKNFFYKFVKGTFGDLAKYFIAKIPGRNRKKSLKYFINVKVTIWQSKFVKTCQHQSKQNWLCLRWCYHSAHATMGGGGYTDNSSPIPVRLIVFHVSILVNGVVDVISKC